MNEIERLQKLSFPRGPFDCVLDTDAFNEVDDQYALSLLLKHEKPCVRAIYAAPFLNTKSVSPEDGMEKSYDEILKLLSLMGKEEMVGDVYKGSRTYLPDESTPVMSEAAEHLVALAREYTPEDPLYIVAIGAITNIASAILLDPDIINRTVLVWLGGNDKTWPNNTEFNLFQDVAGARVVFDSGIPLIQLPCMGVASAFYTTKHELAYYLKGKNALCDYLYEYTVRDTEAFVGDRLWSRIIWDVTAIGWLLNDGNRFMQSVPEPAPIPTYDGHWAFDPHRHLYRRVTYIHRDALFEELFRVLAK